MPSMLAETAIVPLTSEAACNRRDHHAIRDQGLKHNLFCEPHH